MFLRTDLRGHRVAVCELTGVFSKVVSAVMSPAMRRSLLCLLCIFGVESCAVSRADRAQQAALSYVRYASQVLRLSCAWDESYSDEVLVQPLDSVSLSRTVIFEEAASPSDLRAWQREGQLFSVRCANGPICHAVTVRCPDRSACYIVGDTFDDSCDLTPF